jgi:hypothetical protein
MPDNEDPEPVMRRIAAPIAEADRSIAEMQQTLAAARAVLDEAKRRRMALRRLDEFQQDTPPH